MDTQDSVVNTRMQLRYHAQTRLPAAVSILAKRNIEKGEELTHSYGSADESVVSRFLTFGFLMAPEGVRYSFSPCAGPLLSAVQFYCVTVLSTSLSRGLSAIKTLGGAQVAPLAWPGEDVSVLEFGDPLWCIDAVPTIFDLQPEHEKDLLTRLSNYPTTCASPEFNLAAMYCFDT